jgi:hypothetical protein
MICLGNLNKNSYISVISKAKMKNIVVFAFTFVSERFSLIYGDFCMDLYNVDSNEAMK